MSSVLLRKASTPGDRDDRAAAVAMMRAMVAEFGSSPLRAWALVVLGDLLVAQGEREAARSALTEALSVISGLGDEADDVLAVEIERAQDLLGALG